MDKETALIMLGLQRNAMRDCVDPDVWEALGDEYSAIGAECNAAACYRRAEAYRVREVEAVGV